MFHKHATIRPKRRQARRIRYRLLSVAILIMCSWCAPLFAQTEMNDDLFGVSFPDAGKSAGAEKQMGWVCGRWGTILHTQNGAGTWERQQSGTDATLSAICFVDAENGWAVGEEGTIIHTQNGGKSWATQQSPVPGFLMDVCFADSRQGWIVTEKTTILHTLDGGASWSVQFSDEDFILKSISFCDENNGWAVGEFGYTYHTRNGGNTWELQNGSFDLSEDTGEMVGGNFLFHVKALSPDRAWAVGIDGYITQTTDGGESWVPVSAGIPRTHLFGIAADSSGRLLIVGNATLLAGYLDRDPVFQVLSGDTPLKYGWLYGVASTGPQKFIAVGKGGGIYVIDQNKSTRQRISNR